MKPNLTRPASTPHSRGSRSKPISESKFKSELNLTYPKPDTLLNICYISAIPLLRFVRKPEHELFAVSVRDINRALEERVETDLTTKVPKEFYKHLLVFSKRESDKLLKYRLYDYKIELEPNKQYSLSPLYRMSILKLKVLRKYLDDNLVKGFIRASALPVSLPVIFIKKPSSNLRFCVDYRTLNAITIKNRYLIPLLQETLDRLSKAKYFFKFDIRGAFNWLRIAKGDE